MVDDEGKLGERFWNYIRYLCDGDKLLFLVEREGNTVSAKPIFLGETRGKTDKGIFWMNIHAGHRENAMQDVKDRALPWLVGKGADLGCGIEKITKDCIGVDSGEDYGLSTDADITESLDSLSLESDSFDWVFSSNALEHIENWEAALTHAVRILKPGGVIFLYLPWPDRYYLHSKDHTPNHKWNPSPEILAKELMDRDVEILEIDAVREDKWGCFCIVGRKREG
jgi:SAM-dependent methyltransferase